MRVWLGFLWILAAPARGAETGWRPVAEMSVGRYAPTATTLADGRVLVAGGFDGEETVRSAQLFDPGAPPRSGGPGRFTPTGSLNGGRNFATATLLADGKVLIAGGFDARTGTLDTAELYDPATGAFRPTHGQMNSPRELFTATKLPNGKVLLVGGFNTHVGRTQTSAEIYDPATERFTPTGAMRVGRFGHAAAWLPATARLLVVGGLERTRAGWITQRTAEVYDLLTGAFTSVADMAQARDRATAVWIPAMGKALVIGGKGVGPDGAAADVLETEYFDPGSMAFTPGPRLTQGRMAHTLTELPGGRLLVAGGWSVALSRTTETAERFVPEGGGRFEPAGQMAHGRHDHAAALLADGRVLIVGGKEVDEKKGTTTWLRHAEAYSPSESAQTTPSARESPATRATIPANAAPVASPSAAIASRASRASGVASAP
jgi:Galactose oxidase, central domain